VIGHSFGGAIVLAAATSWPDRVRSLTLYEPTAFSLLRGRGAPDAELFRTVLQVRAEMQKRVAGGSHDGAMGHFVDFWNGPGAWDKRPLAERDQLSPLAGKVVSDFRTLFEALWKPEAFRRARFPVLILRGDRSPPAAARVAEILADLIGHARLVTVAGVGHMVPVTDSGLIAATIREHIRASGSPEHLEAALKAPRDPTPSQEVTHGNVAARSEFLSIPAPGRESAA